VTTQSNLPKEIGTIFHHEGGQSPPDKADETVLFGVVMTLVFDIGQREHLIKAGKVYMAPLEDLLPFGFIPSATHEKSV
jgi:hypothetical protein